MRAEIKDPTETFVELFCSLSFSGYSLARSKDAVASAPSSAVVKEAMSETGKAPLSTGVGFSFLVLDVFVVD